MEVRVYQKFNLQGEIILTIRDVAFLQRDNGKGLGTIWRNPYLLKTRIGLCVC